MTARRTALGVLLCLGLAQAAPARAEDPTVLTQPLDTSILGDVVDGIGGVLKVLVGPPISSPTPYIEGREPLVPESSPHKEGGETVKAAPARAEDPAVLTQPLDTSILGDVVDGIGGVLKVLVGPPISSPTPYIEGREPPVPVPPAVAVAPPAVSPAAVAPPAPDAPPLPAAVASPVVKSVPPPLSAPPPRPATPVVAAPVAVAPAAVVPPVPVCSVRVAATATLEQMRRLPRCP